jgi:long-chain acyl-CoA synthetase
MPDKVASMMADGETVLTYEQLDRRSTQLVRLLRAAGLSVGDHIAVLMENRPEFLETCWAAQRCGLYYTPVNTRLSADEAAYIINDCQARVLFTSAAVAGLAAALIDRTPRVERRLVVGDGLDGHESYQDSLDSFSFDPLDNQVDGMPMFYTSGTTGRPKGIMRPIRGCPVGTDDPWGLDHQLQGFAQDGVYLSPAPLYHIGPLHTSMTMHRVGGTLVLIKGFDAETTLEAIERHHVTRLQLVPTMMWRLLRLPSRIRDRYDLSSLRYVMHSGAPCSPEVKREMIDWLGPIVNELYGTSESIGGTLITSQEWLAHPGSVGRPFPGCEVHIADDDGTELAPGQDGTVWLSSAASSGLRYHNDPVKTAGLFNDRGWATVGDIGHTDAEGYLYLTDRRANVIISGGVNIYPQETENVLLTHPAVADVAVFGLPNPEWGQEVKAVVQLDDPTMATAELARELIDFSRERIAHYKCPRSVDFITDLPREPGGKLLKRLLQEQYSPPAVELSPSH